MVSERAASRNSAGRRCAAQHPAATVLLFFATVAARSAVCQGAAGVQSVVCQDAIVEPAVGCRLVAGQQKDALAYGKFVDNMESTGWAHLYLNTPGAPDDDGEYAQAFGAGYLEGALSHTRIYQHHSNLLGMIALRPPSNATLRAFNNFLLGNNEWVKESIKNHSQLAAAGGSSSSKLPPYWHTAKLIQEQLRGLVQGYNEHRDQATEPQLSLLDVLRIQVQGDGADILHAVTPGSQRPDIPSMSAAQLAEYELVTSHCSAMIRLTPTFDDLIVGHTMWWQYYAMLRVFKHVSMPVRGRAAQQFMMSSYPGTLASTDDYYQLGSGLVVLETSLNVYDMSLYDKVSPDSMLSWSRAMIANLLAENATGWHETFQQYNSGTYNNAWMVVDYNLFTPSHEVPPNTLVVGEQLPGYYHFEDQTAKLRLGYFPSYNRAMYPQTQQLSGMDVIVAKHGTDFSYQLARRAQIFRRDHHTVKNATGMAMLIRSNNYQVDPIAGGDPCNQLCCRADLRASSPMADGGIDGKVVSYQLFKNRSTRIIAGPTHEAQPVFDWETAPASVRAIPHAGQPQRFDFEWFTTTQDL